MAEQNPTRHDPPNDPRPGTLSCEDWDRLMVDALDGALSAEQSAAFELHRQQCAACTEAFEEARRGVAWLGYLRNDPQVPGDLLGRILARTSGPSASALAVAAHVPLPPPPALKAPPLKAWYRTALPAAHRVVEPRMWMTAAMAFFSIALTLNLLGIRISDIRLADLQPSTVFTNVKRQYYTTEKEGVRYYENLRFVYEMEARVRELRRNQEISPEPSTPPQTAPRPQSPSSLNRFPGNRVPGRRSTKPQARSSSLATIDEAPSASGAPIDRAMRTRAERSRA